MQLAMQSCDCPTAAAAAAAAAVTAKLSHGLAQFVIHPAQAAAVPSAPIPHPLQPSACEGVAVEQFY